ncbi:ATP-dependent DNA helicase RecG [Marinicella sp. S1101]|uniref:ATP-dependent DNA helicase RecG n=1 Tax=Marinicella marina TaxID=2996016 RepID=UPI0022610439|nr:ATP-dependent DNA helicase RecG [Marinicella marina]MCX7554951.1 ATP-dependent DNA helicase RecG [Marinicella marina]MDJ1141561.1 ATP-dependent DNA helicase RecG [Marinicella marina]
MELTRLKGIGQTTADKLHTLGIDDVIDMLFHLPLRYEDKTCITAIADLTGFGHAQVEGEIVKSYVTQGRRPILVVEVADESAVMQLKFFNFYYSQKIKMRAGLRIRAYGEVKHGMYGMEIIHPEFSLGEKQPALAKSLTPVYPKSEGISQKLLQKAAAQTVQMLQQGELALRELLPTEWLAQQGMPGLREALMFVHQPPAGADVMKLLNQSHPAQQRLKIEEILAHFLAMHQARTAVQQSAAPELPINQQQNQLLLSQLPFELTAAQQRVVQEIQADMSRGFPMQRLVQGDVGSGKTVVAALAMQAGLVHGKQVVMMAPTEILAEQHLVTLKEYFKDKQVVFLSGKIKGKARVDVLAQIAGEADVIIGTHALFQPDVIYRDLALVIIDEQHRFGVHQRLMLKEKGQNNTTLPHSLIMTATPIPRTLAQIAYANLDVSVIDELPPNRKVINTVLLDNHKIQPLAERIRNACKNGEQAYWVCTLIEESEHMRAKAAQDTYEALQQQFPDLTVGLVHGRLKSDDKQAVMDAFKANEIQLLVATTVIEVGVDVPNASLMVIENAERLGLSQLHQLRGRVGRGNRQSHCVLVYQAPLSENAQVRLQTMRETNDGFIIAQKDLQLRGPGEILGTRQKGSMEFRFSDPEQDAQLFEQAKQMAAELLQANPEVCDQIIERWEKQAKTLAKV